MDEYRHLTEKEIQRLENNSCIADDWNNVLVKDKFNTNRIFQSSFSGNIKLGNFEKKFILEGGITKKSGVRYATLHNVTVGDNTCVENVQNYIANYEIGHDTYIKNVGLILVNGVSTFGEGTHVAVLNETGGREVVIHSKLSAHMAYLSALYRHRPILQQRFKELADYYSKKHSSSIGKIGSNVVIENSEVIKNVRIGDYAVISGTSRLENGSINSNKEAPVHIGSNVTCKNFIISSGSELSYGAMINDCFIGQACCLSHSYSASSSLFFSNCHEENGEACAIFAGPYTVTHHKSTLLIAGMFSFMNAGSGSNQSNHMYKLGPIHHGILERGSKTSSDSYILFPSHIGPFSLIMGRHVDHVDTQNLPFSYLIENQNSTFVMPGVNLRSVGTIRDVRKWPKRDKRTDPKKLDYINFNLLSPYTIQKMFKGIDILKELQKVSGPDSDIYSFRGAKIRNSSLNKGLNFYNIGINKFFGNALVNRLKDIDFKNSENPIDLLRNTLKPHTHVGLGDWVDLSGLITPKSEVTSLINKIENNTICRLEDINNEFARMASKYYEYEWTWIYDKFEMVYHINPEKITFEDVIKIIKEWKKAVVSLDEMVYNDAKKEFSLSFMTGFGADGDKDQKLKDFEEVRGDFDTNPFVQDVLLHIKNKSALGDELISHLIF